MRQLYEKWAKNEQKSGKRELTLIAENDTRVEDFANLITYSNSS